MFYFFWEKSGQHYTIVTLTKMEFAPQLIFLPKYFSLLYKYSRENRNIHGACFTGAYLSFFSLFC